MPLPSQQQSIRSNTQKRRDRRKIIMKQTRLFNLVRVYWYRHKRYKIRQRINKERLVKLENERLDTMMHTVYFMNGDKRDDICGRTARRVIETLYPEYGAVALFEHGCEDQLYNESFHTSMVLFAIPITVPTDTTVNTCVPDDFLSTASSVSTNDIYRMWRDSQIHWSGSATPRPMDLFALRRSDGSYRFARMMGLGNSPFYISFEVIPMSNTHDYVSRQFYRSNTLEKDKIFTWKGVIAGN